MRILIFIALKILEVTGVALFLFLTWLIGTYFDPMETWFWKVGIGIWCVAAFICVVTGVPIAIYRIISTNWHWADNIYRKIKK